MKRKDFIERIDKAIEELEEGQDFFICNYLYPCFSNSSSNLRKFSNNSMAYRKYSSLFSLEEGNTHVWAK